MPGENTMIALNEGAGPELPANDRALIALAEVLEDLGNEAEHAFVRNGPGDGEVLDACRARAAAVVGAIVALPAVTLHGASAKARAARASTAVSLLPRALVDRLGFDMAADIERLRGGEGVGHA